ncbi:MAG: amidohydrolase family protein [Nitriliruptorales bacterium]|nr:amidohydrolase family protein [Nitriliruptorales bacterium]
MRRWLRRGDPPAVVEDAPTVSWWRPAVPGAERGLVAYRGYLAGGAPLTLHYGFDGWEGGAFDASLEPVGGGVHVAAVPGLADHWTLDLVVTDGERWDDNYGLDYRLWIGVDPVDSHVHASGLGMGDRRADSLHAAMRSAGITQAIVSWRDNRFVDWLIGERQDLYGLVWVRPRKTSLEEVDRRLSTGHVGLKLHPSFDRYRANHPALDPYLELAAHHQVPVAVHSAPGNSDPDLIRRLAERWPSVEVVLYHTYMGPYEGRDRAIRHTLELPNLHLETSWCVWEEALRIIEQVGANRVLFGSDAAVDAEHHYVRQPPNVEGRQTYNVGMVELARRIGRDGARQVFADNTRGLFRLPEAAREEQHDVSV